MNELLATLDIWRCISFLVALVLFWIVTGFLKERQLIQEGDSRKINHIVAFAGGSLLFGWLPEPIARTNLYVVSLSILLLVAAVCYYRDRVLFRYAYAANTRQSDAPNAAFFFWFSWVVSITALITIDLLFSKIAITRIATLVVGIADGIAEPIGQRYGRLKYRVWSFWGFPSFRSLEGSLAVLLGTFVVMLGCSHPAETGLVGWLATALLTACAVTGVEAISPRGSDNFTILLTAASLTSLFLNTGWIQ